MITVITMMHVHDDDVDNPGDGFHPDHVDVHDGDDVDDHDDCDDDDDHDHDDDDDDHEHDGNYGNDDDDDGNHEDGGGTSDPNLEVQAIQIWRYKRTRALQGR